MSKLHHQLICLEANDKTVLSAQYCLVITLAQLVHGKDTADVLIDYATQTLGMWQK
jgi:hypothetical protein